MNEKQRDGMERAGETGEIIDRRAGERRATAPVVAVVAADLHRDIMNLPCKAEEGWGLIAVNHYKIGHRDARHAAADLVNAALASQAQAAVSTPVQMLSGALNHARETLRFYAEGEHFIIADPNAWDTVSGEPQNFQCDEAGTATVEDGSLAKKVLEDIAHVERFAGLAAQAAVGVARQQEQQPQPSCNAALRAAPEGQLDANVRGLSLRLKLDWKEAWDTERGWIEVIAEEVTIEGAGEHRFAVHHRPDSPGEFTVTHVETGFALAHAESPDYAIELARKRWTECDPESRSLKLMRARNLSKVPRTPALNVPRVRGEGEDVPITMSTYGAKEACEAEQARRNASPDLASIASQAQGEPIVIGVDLAADGIAAVRNAALDEAIEACEQVKRETYDDSIEEWSGAVSCCTAIEALKTPTGA